jgi:tetratricopeptide (TPR) repeat protein
MSPAPARVDELKKRYEENPRRFFAPLANEYRKAGDLEAAIDLCRMHLEEQPGHLSGHIVFGQALFESARPDEAKKAFEAALTLDPENLIALRHLGDIARAEGDAPAATLWYQRVLDADPRNDEVIALIDGLKRQPAPVSTVVVAEQTAPPPVPQYAVEAPALPPAEPVAPAAQAAPAAPAAPVAVDPHAPTPVVATPAVQPPSVRPSIGLMDLDLNLADATSPTVDLIGIGDAAAPPVDIALPPVVDEPGPAFEEGFPLVDGTLAAASAGAPELLGAEDAALGLTGPDVLIDGHGTSFDIERPSEEEPTFAAAKDETAFGDALDVSAVADVEPHEPPSAGPFDSLPMLDLGVGTPLVEPVASATAPTATAPTAEPAAPSAGDFDLLFGNAPIADVQIGGDAAAPADAEGFMADSFIGREPADQSLDHAPDIATPPSPFVTETMAELYLQQGFRDEALGVYRQLLAQHPDDHGLAERVRQLELGSRSSLAIDQPIGASDVGAVEALREALPDALPDAEPEAEREAAALVEPAAASFLSLPDAVPAFMVEAPAAVAVAPAAAVAAAVGPTARDVLARVAMRRAVPGGGLALSPSAASDAADAAHATSAVTAPTAVAGTADLVSVAAGGRVDQLFGMGGVAPEDEGAAATMAAAFGGVPPTPIRGEPTRRVTDELSLNSVFKDDTAAAKQQAVERQSTKLRFDQFFAGTGDASASPAPSYDTSQSAAPGKSEEDVAQFNTWLKGLKGS